MHVHPNHPQRLVEVAPLPSRSPHRERSRRGIGTIIAFAITFTFILALILGGLGLPSPINAPTQTSEQH